MTIRAANNHTPGVRTFYLTSDSGKEYTLQHVRRAGQRRWYCTCPDFTYRRVAHKRHCKHLKQVAKLAQLAKGVSHLPAAIAQFANLPKTISVTEMATRGAA